MVVEVTDPDDRVTVSVHEDHVRVQGGATHEGGPRLRGDAVTLVEALSMRAVEGTVPEGVGWLTAGLAEVFDQPSAP
jgi:hypothetical protein